MDDEFSDEGSQQDEYNELSIESFRAIMTELSALAPDGEEYKTQSLYLLEQMMRKFEEDADYQKSLEEQVEILADECRQKDDEIERVSVDAQEAINECRRQAEAMAENMFSKISGEMNERVGVEKVVGRLQRELTATQSELKLLRLAGASKTLTGQNESESETVVKAKTEAAEHMHKKMFLLSQQLVDVKKELTSCRGSRDREMAAVTRLTGQLNQRIVDLEKRTKAVVTNYNEKCEETKQLTQRLDELSLSLREKSGVEASVL